MTGETVGGLMVVEQRTRADQIRDLIMIAMLAIWIIFGIAFVVQIYTSGAKVIDSLPPIWFWGLPAAPFTALYNPWVRPGPGTVTPPDPPPETPTPATETTT